MVEVGDKRIMILCGNHYWWVDILGVDVDGRGEYRGIVVVEGDEEQKLVFALGPAFYHIVGRYRIFRGEM